MYKLIEKANKLRTNVVQAPTKVGSSLHYICATFSKPKYPYLMPCPNTIDLRSGGDAWAHVGVRTELYRVWLAKFISALIA